MEKKICRACQLSKDITSFYKSGNGYLPRCKQCIRSKKLIYEKKPESHQTKRKWATFDDNHFKIGNPTKSDYQGMWDLLRELGYECNPNKSIHQQFLEKHGLKMKIKSDYKNIPQYLCDGSLNPRWLDKKKKSQSED